MERPCTHKSKSGNVLVLNQAVAVAATADMGPQTETAAGGLDQQRTHLPARLDAQAVVGEQGWQLAGGRLQVRWG